MIFALLGGAMITTVALGQTAINVAGPGTGGAGYVASDGVIAITAGGEYVLTGSTTSNRVAVGAGVTATITLRNVSITSAEGSPLSLSPDNCEVTLRLAGENALVSDAGSDWGGAGVQVEGSARLIIEGGNSLFARGGAGAAGIGGDSYASGGSIAINGGNITAIGGSYGAGIGNGREGVSGSITINGGNITATGGEEGAGIGAGNITITGGTMLAVGGNGKPGIGGAYASVPDNIRISGGGVFAIGGADVSDIGSGSGNILISGGFVVAETFEPDMSTVVSGGLVFAQSINAGGATASEIVLLPITDAVVRHFFANTPKTVEELLVVDDIRYNYITVHVSDTQRIFVPTDEPIYVHDTLLLAAEALHDTFFLYLHDTTATHWPDTLDRDHILLVRDTTHITKHDSIVRLHLDTLFTPVETLQLLHDTLIRYDTLSYDYYLRLTDNALTTAISSPTLAGPAVRAIDIAHDVLLSNLTPHTPFAVYTVSGLLIIRDIAPKGGAYLLPNLPGGAYLLWHNGRWGKFGHK